MFEDTDDNDSSKQSIQAFYSHLDSTTCEQIVGKLRAKNFTISTHELHKENEDREIIFDNIYENSRKVSVVLVFLSTSFSQSKSSNTIFYLSSSSGIPLLSLIIEKDFEPVEELGVLVARYGYVRWSDDPEVASSIDDVEKQIRELIPPHIPTKSDCDVLATLDSILDILNEEDNSKVDIDEICQSLCVTLKSTKENIEDPKQLLPIAVEVFLRYNLIIGKNDDHFIKLSKDIGSEIDSFLQKSLLDAEKHDPFGEDHKRAQMTFSRVFNSLATFPTTIYFLDKGFMLKNSNHARILFWAARILLIASCRRLFNTEQDAVKFPQQQIVLQMWLKYVDENTQSFNYTNLIPMLLAIFQNLSANVGLVPLFVDACFPSTVVSWLSSITWMLNDKLQLIPLTIIYNFARHKSGVDALNQLGTIEILQIRQPFFKSNTARPDANTLYHITLALLYKPENINHESVEIEAILKELLSKTLFTFQDPKLTYGILPLREFFLAFNILFINEELITKTLEQTVDGKSIDANFFMDMFTNTLKEDILAQTLLLNIMYRITSTKSFRHQVKENHVFVNTLKKLKSKSMKNIYLPRYTVDLLTAVNGILRNLNMKEQSSTDKSVKMKVFSNQSNSIKKKVMISYSHQNKGFCKALSSKLEEDSQLSIWADWKRSGHNYAWKDIGTNMDKADVIICIVTQDYVGSQNCMCEFRYAIEDLDMKSKNGLIPILIGRDYKLPGHVAIPMKGPDYIRFNAYKGFDMEVAPSTQDESFTSKCQAVRDRILYGSNEQDIEKDKTVVSKTDDNKTNTIEPKIVTAPTKPVHEWTEQDIAQWLASIPVPHELTALCKFQSVEELLDYAHDFKVNETIIYVALKDEFKDKYGSTLQRKHYLSLKNAFEQLLVDNQSKDELNVQKSSQTQTNTITSRSCMLM
ncbi:unnamed protein product [Adineta ricciae]|uniref:TIR domain-containing protein n=1 Tax=Adineta ricciae TaxID=249248 RepID=A0A815LMU9_ADIRI|nr:unnamed protein product [Adineta ricciae]CAF1408087.1 unnamed protein product [Adineta ricciae]